MASAVLEAQSLIQSANFTELNTIYTNNLPEEVINGNSTDSTYCLITNVSNSPDLYGNKDFYAVNREVELQIVYSINIDYDPESFEINFLRLFKSNDWDLTDIRGHTVDPDTQQLTATFYFTQLKIIEEN